MELSEEPVPEMDKHRSFGFFSSTAKTTEVISRGVDALSLREKPSRLLPTVSIANTEAAEGVQYPLRPFEPDCSYYLKHGCCKFGSLCRFNHPRERRLSQIFNSKERDRGSPKQDGRCKFYLMPGGCRFGEACKYSYSHGKSGNVPVDLNALGLPFRPGKGECPYYIRTGICKYYTSCKFHHPEPKYFVGVRVFGFQNGITFENKIRNLHLIEASNTLKTASNECNPLLDSSKPYVPAMSFSQWLNVYVDESRCLDSSSSSLEKTTSCPPLAVSQNSLSKLVDASMQKKATIDENLKESPSESNSCNCMRYEGFKLIPACTHNHPKDHPLKLEACQLSPIGLPLRPDQPVCIYFGRFGICKYGPACQFDHPMDGSMDQSSQVLSTVATSL